jgi:nucleotide-binding universal stress UspA family protein
MKRVRRILVPLDGTPTAAMAVRPACDIALRRDAELLILHIATSGNRLPKEPGTYIVGMYMDQPQHEWPLWAREFLERFIIAQSELVSKLRLRLHLASGDPSEEIIHFARDHKVDVIVTAWQGRTPLDESKVIRPLLRNSPCPVLIVRTKFDEEPGMTKTAGSNRN